MAISPIDLQTMYSQLSNVSKAVNVQQQAQLSEAMQQQTNIQKDLEKQNKVNQTSNDKANTSLVNENGSGGSSFNQSQSKNNSKKEEDEVPRPKENPYNPYLGSIIDISR